MIFGSLNALLLRVTIMFHWHGRPNGKIAPPPVDHSVLLLRQLDQRHGNQEWLDCWRSLECGRHPPYLALSGTRRLGQVLVLSQVELLSECRRVKGLFTRGPSCKTFGSAVSAQSAGRFPQLIIKIGKGYMEVLSSSSCGNK